MSGTVFASLEGLGEVVAALRTAGKRVVHARGTFDLLDRAEVARLRAVRDTADALVVTIGAGDGTHSPIVSADLRARVVASLPFVHGVALERSTELEAARTVVGADTSVEIERPPVEEPPVVSEPRVGDVTGETDRAFKRRAHPPPLAQEFLREFRLRYTSADVLGAIEGLRKLRVLVVGDAIIDEYHFVQPYGMPSKAPVVAAQFIDAETYAGGALAVANHVAGICDDVHLVTVLGESDSREAFVREKLKPNIQPKLFLRRGAPTVTKRRYLMRYMVQKLLEVSFFDAGPLPADVDTAIGDHLASVAASYDVIIVADFGHGLISQRSADLLSEHARFLAVNTQLNSMNYGYHVITKYRRMDYGCIDEPEIRMATRDRVSPVHDIVQPLAAQLGAKVFAVTRGHRGSLTYRDDGTYVSVPVLSRQVVDTIGAGDAYLAVTAPCIGAGLSSELVGFIGNAVGALAVRILGNKESVSPATLFPFIEALLAED